jgi:hypothetical protein
MIVLTIPRFVPFRTEQIRCLFIEEKLTTEDAEKTIQMKTRWSALLICLIALLRVLCG